MLSFRNERAARRYLDADVVVLGDVGALWEMDLGANAVAGVPDPYGQHRCVALGIPPTREYVNAGVLLINLLLWRQEGITERLVRYVLDSGCKLVHHDQDAINAVLYDFIAIVDYKWNFNAWMCQSYWRRNRAELHRIRRQTPEVIVLHYASQFKPWMFDAIVPNKHLYYRYLGLTAWAGARNGVRWPRRLPRSTRRDRTATVHKRAHRYAAIGRVSMRAA